MEIRNTDRRQNDTPVEFDRRSGVDRRAQKLEKEHSSLFYALETVPTFRRAALMSSRMDDNDNIGALGAGALTLINLPEDLRDVKGAFNQLQGTKPLYDYKNYQHNFSFFRGTVIEKWFYKKVKAGQKWAKWLYNNDVVLADTKFGQKALKLVNANESDVIRTAIKDFHGMSVQAVSCEGSLFAKLTSRALRRTTKLGLFAAILLEAPKILKSDNKIKQTAKSAINVASITAGIAYGGAIGSKYGKSFGSLVGMGVGAILGNKLSDKVQNTILT